jgi:hypothetical protein
MRFATLGPKGTCHENAVKNYLGYHQLGDSEILLIDDFFNGLEMIRQKKVDYLVQCSAHPTVHLVTEKYYEEIFITDTFIFPTKDLALLEDVRIENPRTLGLVKATEGYLGEISYPEVIYEQSKPIVGENLINGMYDAGLAYLEHYAENPGRFRMRLHIGPVITTWLVYGKTTAFKGQVLGAADKGYFESARSES